MTACKIKKGMKKGKQGIIKMLTWGIGEAEAWQEICAPKIKLYIKQSKGAQKTGTAHPLSALLRDEMESRDLNCHLYCSLHHCSPFELSSSAFLCLLQKHKQPPK